MLISKEPKGTLFLYCRKIFSTLVNVIPANSRAFYRSVLGNLVYVFSHRDRFKAQRNVSLAFGREMNKKQLNMLGRKNFINMGKMAIDVVRIRSITNEN